VAVIAITPGVPLNAITQELVHCLSSIGPTARITPEVVRETLGPTALDPGNDFKLTAWLGSQEDQHKTVVYQCDGMERLSPWTQQCVRHADCILIFANADQSPAVSNFEEKLETVSLRVTKELVLIHPQTTEIPRGTRRWLENRSWISDHYHIKLPERLLNTGLRKSERKLSDFYRRLVDDNQKPDINSDFARLARMITGTSVGLVLGGGGARGCSHVGMIRAILEAGIPIDRVAGVSIGAFMGGLWCQERDISKITVKARSFCLKMAQKWRMVLDLTYPFSSMMSGFGFNCLIEEVFTETNIEDLWLPYFTVTTDISVSSMKVHESGSLWRYVRSSMSLAGYMPPLCDPADGNLLLDGGYTNNLPADIMKTKGAKHILAVDVGSLDQVNLHNYGDWLSGWKILWARLNPFATVPRVLSQAEIQVRLAYVSCVRQLELMKTADYVDYIRPPIDKYGMLQFDAFDEIRDIGYYHGQTYFAGLKKAGQLFVSSEKEKRRGSLESISEHEGVISGGGRGRHPSQGYARFTDLAEMVCRVRQTTPDREALEFGLMSEDFVSESEPDSDDIISDPDEDEDMMEEDESGFLSQAGQEDFMLTNMGIVMSKSDLSTPRSRASTSSTASRQTYGELVRNVSGGNLSQRGPVRNVSDGGLVRNTSGGNLSQIKGTNILDSRRSSGDQDKNHY